MSALLQVKALCCQATSCYLIEWWYSISLQKIHWIEISQISFGHNLVLIREISFKFGASHSNIIVMLYTQSKDLKAFKPSEFKINFGGCPILQQPTCLVQERLSAPRECLRRYDGIFILNWVPVLHIYHSAYINLTAYQSLKCLIDYAVSCTNRMLSDQCTYWYFGPHLHTLNDTASIICFHDNRAMGNRQTWGPLCKALGNNHILKTVEKK